jgi:hypothetical protein
MQLFAKRALLFFKRRQPVFQSANLGLQRLGSRGVAFALSGANCL